MGDLLIGDELEQHKASERAISFFLVCILGLEFVFLSQSVSYLLMPWLRAQVSRHISSVLFAYLTMKHKPVLVEVTIYLHTYGVAQF